jgi:hypothetical protein
MKGIAIEERGLVRGRIPLGMKDGLLEVVAREYARSKELCPTSPVKHLVQSDALRDAHGGWSPSRRTVERVARRASIPVFLVHTE